CPCAPGCARRTRAGRGSRERTRCRRRAPSPRSSRSTSAAAAPRRASLLLLAAWVCFQRVDVDGLGLLLVLLREQKLPAIVQVVRREGVLLRHLRDVTVLAILRRIPLFLRLGQQWR